MKPKTRNYWYAVLAILALSLPNVSGENLEQMAKSSLTYYDLKDDSLVGYWDFDDSGIYSGHNYSEIEKPYWTMDSSDYGNHGNLIWNSTNSGPAWVSGKFGSALNFDGVDDYVLVIAND